MTSGNLELVQVIASWLVSLPAVILVIRGDERRLTGLARERSWPSQSRDSAIFGMWNLGAHPLCILVHFVRTRRSPVGWLIGLGWVMAIFIVDAGAQAGAAAAIEWFGL